MSNPKEPKMRNGKFIRFNKGEILSLKYKRGKRIYRGVYQSRYFNNEVKCWVYVLKALDQLTTYTLLAPDVKVLLRDKGA